MYIFNFVFLPAKKTWKACWLHVCTCVCMYIFNFVFLPAKKTWKTYVCIYVHAYALKDTLRAEKTMMETSYMHMYVHLCICMYIYAYVCTYACMHAKNGKADITTGNLTYACISMYVFFYVCMIFVRMHAYLFACMTSQTWAQTWALMCIHREHSSRIIGRFKYNSVGSFAIRKIANLDINYPTQTQAQTHTETQTRFIYTFATWTVRLTETQSPTQTQTLLWTVGSCESVSSQCVNLTYDLTDSGKTLNGVSLSLSWTNCYIVTVTMCDSSKPGHSPRKEKILSSEALSAGSSWVPPARK